MWRPKGSAEPIHALTSLRFFAAIWVVLHHYGLCLWPWGGLTKVLERGGTGVALFFVLSGFVLAINYPLERLNLRSFLIARLARVYPLYLLSLVVSLPLFLNGNLYQMTVLPAVVESVQQFLLSAALLQAWFPDRATMLNPASWSLSVEAIFYLSFVPLLAWRPSRRFIDQVVVSVSVFWLVGLGFVLAWMQAHPGLLPSADLTSEQVWSVHFISFLPLVRLPEFLIGVALGRWHLSGGRLAWPGRVAFAALAVIAGTLWWAPPAMSLQLHNCLLALPFGLAILGVAQSDSQPVRWLGRPILVLLGEASYAIYIIHIPAHEWLKLISHKIGIPTDGRAWLLFYLAVVVSCSIALFHWVEVPARRRIRSLFESPK